MKRWLKILMVAMMAICCTSINADAQFGKLAQKGAKIIQKVTKKTKPKIKPKTLGSRSTKKLMPVTCPKCHGQKKIYNGRYYETCKRCNGSGKTVVRY